MKTLLVLFIISTNYYPAKGEPPYEQIKMEIQTDNADACSAWAEAINTPNRGKAVGASSWAYCK